MNPTFRTYHLFITSVICISILAIFFLTSCGGGSGHAISSQPAETRAVSEREAETQAVVEHALRIKSDERLQQQESATGQWQSLTLILSACAGLLLLVGAALGSRARHEAEKK